MRAFAAQGSLVRFAAGQTLCEEGAPSQWVFSITAGVASLHKALPDGRRQTIGFLFPGDLLGLTPGSAHECGAEAIADVEACRFARPRFMAALDEYPALRPRLLHMTATELAAAQDHMLLLGRKTAGERVASFLLQLSQRAASHDLPDNPVLLPMRRTVIADYLGLTVETVSRTFTHLARAGVIETLNKSTIRIVSANALRHAASSR